MENFAQTRRFRSGFRLPHLLAALIAFCAAAPAVAQGDVFEAGLRPGWQMPNGNQMVAVHISLDPGWKTYWRAPGDSGIPPQFDWAGSSNIKSVRFHWPRPHVYDPTGLRTIGYKHELVLPIEVSPVDPGKPMRLKAAVDLGVCSDICIPASFDIKADLPRPGAADDKISQALRQRPSTPKEAGLGAIACVLEPASDGLRLTAKMDLPSTGQPETVVFETGKAELWVSQADVTRQGNSLIAQVDIAAPGKGPITLERDEIIVSVLGQRRAVEITGCPAG